MLKRVWTMYTVEIDKAVRQRTTWGGPVLIVLSMVLALIYKPVHQDSVSDYAFIAYATPLALNMIGFLLLVVFSAGLLAQEIGQGQTRMMLTRPILRRDYIFAKLLTGMTYAVLLAALAFTLGWGIPLLFGDLQGVTIGGELLYTAEHMFMVSLLGALLSLAPLFAAVSVSLAISALSRSAASAITIAVGLFLLLDAVKHPLGIARFVFTTWLEGSWQVFVNESMGIDVSWWPMAGYTLITSGAVFILSTVVSLLVIHRKNFL